MWKLLKIHHKLQDMLNSTISTGGEMSKVNLKKIIIITCILLVVGLGYFVSALFFENKVSEFRTEVLFDLSENTLNIQCIPYEYLDERYRSVVTKAKYNEADTSEEVVNILKLFNDVPHMTEPITGITTDGYRTYPSGIVEVNGLSYEIYHHIDFEVRNFKPCVVKWYVDIIEVE